MGIRHRSLTSAAAALGLLMGLLVASVALSGPAAAAGTLTVSVLGRGDVSGDVISCNENGGTCSHAYSDTQECDPDLKPPCHNVPGEVDLVAGPDRSGYTFLGFSGCDSVTGRTCSVTMSTAQHVVASFADVTAPLVALNQPSSGLKHGSITMSA